MRLVANTIKGRDVEHALNILKFSNKEASRRLEKLVISAIYNWETKNEGQRYDESELYIKEIFVDSARMLKRFRPAPMGRAHRIRKRSNHVTVVIDSKFAAEEVEPLEVEEVEESPVEEVEQAEEKEQAEEVEQKEEKKQAKESKESKEDQKLKETEKSEEKEEAGDEETKETKSKE